MFFFTTTGYETCLWFANYSLFTLSIKLVHQARLEFSRSISALPKKVFLHFNTEWILTVQGTTNYDFSLPLLTSCYNDRRQSNSKLAAAQQPSMKCLSCVRFIAEHKPVRAAVADMLSLFCLFLSTRTHTQPNYQTRIDKLALGKHKCPFFPVVV